MILAPIGYPEISPKIKAKAHAPFTLNTLLVTGESLRDSAVVIEMLESIVVIKRYGKRVGNTQVIKSKRPWFTAFTYPLPITNKKHSAVISRKVKYSQKFSFKFFIILSLNIISA